MKLVFNLCLVCFISFNLSHAQQPFYKSYDWEANPEYTVQDLHDENMAGIKEKIVSEFYFEGDDLTEYFLEHKVYYLNSDEKIEAYNKVYLPYDSESNLEINKARVITAKGEIINLDDSKILTATDSETNRTYKYFAFEGIEKGSFIEYIYVVKRYPNYRGKRINLQADYNKLNVEFDLYAPSNLLFKFKSFNGLDDVVRDTITEDKKHWFLKLNSVKLLEPEELAVYNADKKFLIYALDSNTASRTRDITSYANVSQNIYDFYNKELSKKEVSELKKFLKDIDFKESDDIDTKLRAIESYIKTNIFIANSSGDKLSELLDIIKDKVANDRGIIKLYASILNYLDIKNEFVYTCSREYMRFDEEFEANNFLQDILIYFPKTKTYLSPTEIDSRYGFPPAYLTDTYGLFIKEVVIGDFKSAVGKVKYIQPIAAEHNVDKMIIDVTFDADDISKTNIKLDRAMSGYYGMYIHPYMDLIQPDSEKEISEGLAKNLDEDAEITNKVIKNRDSKFFGIKPIQFIIDFNSSKFVEKAGRKYLFNVGDLIGRQQEMYQEKERVLPVESEFQRSYFRTINITIPEGYTIANLDDITIKNDYTKDGKVLMSFDSYYELNGNVLTITADEHYRINHIDTSIYEDYRTVINSAADFNKVTLVLEAK
ncbi:DUF3857 domain-containing protein [Psychroserpens sp. SPM9]|uniref:DUF3857 domain-containing protein n=1 Tax=Psychroserpens sp. SPM9 TaxID=2975598 RepID=UPI0021A6F4CC|nr:DUF3857 domain-containing protein [Psychroserpens sp. SPM9]MDG5490831.1 DUF3857 domain-containing protein [Psychroserpens sp. SPM9]